MLVATKTTVKELSDAVGGLSNPSKMPGHAYGIPAKDCIIGSILRAREGTVCSKCYAHKGMYVFPVVQNAQRERLKILSDNLQDWQENMVRLLIRKYRKKAKKDRVFRWHDSGDLQDMLHLLAIVSIAKKIHWLRFWLPTKEYALIRDYLREHPEGFPANLCVRVSNPSIGQVGVDIPGTQASSVGTSEGFQCGAYKRGGFCGPCRACWNKKVPLVSYPEH